MVGLVVMLGIGSLAFGERIPLNDGLGWDGLRYGTLAADLPGAIASGVVEDYTLRRALPSALVYVGLTISGVERDTDAIVLGFAILTLVALTCVALLWRPIADSLELDVQNRWLGFVGLFGSFLVLKQLWYVPVLTDAAALACGAAALCLYLEGRTASLALVGIAASFAWPTAGVAVAVLLLWSRGAAPLPPRTGRSLGDLVALGVTILFVGAFLFMYQYQGVRQWGGSTRPIVEELVYASLLAYALTTFLGMRALIGGADWPWIRRALFQLSLRGLALAVAVIVIPAALRALLPTTPGGALSVGGFGKFIVFYANTRPLLHLVSHVIFFGPIVALSLVLWPRIAGLMRAEGPGLLAFAVLTVAVALTPESRQSVLSLPFVVAFTVRAFQNAAPSARLVLPTALVALALSKVWLPITTAAARAASDRLPGGDEIFVQYGRLYMNAGPWMSNRAYVVHAAIAVMLCLGYGVYLRRTPGPAHPPRAVPQTAVPTG